VKVSLHGHAWEFYVAVCHSLDVPIPKQLTLLQYKYFEMDVHINEISIDSVELMQRNRKYVQCF